MSERVRINDGFSIGDGNSDGDGGRFYVRRVMP
jgi:hypothetical protein